MVKSDGIRFLLCILSVCVLGLEISACQNSKITGDIESCKHRVHQFCMNAKPVIMPETGNVSFPEMDDTTLLAAARLARQGDKQFYSDLAAVIIRVNRAQELASPTSIPFEDTQDVPRHFTARYGAYMWQVLGSNPVLSEIADWIRSENGRLFSSELLTAELSQ